MPSKARWAGLYRSKVSPKVGDLIFAYHKGVHRVLEVRDKTNPTYPNERLVTYIQVADQRLNPILRNRRIQSCDILWTTPFDEAVRADCYVNPEEIIKKVKSYG
jgi:hypothetical protein